MATFHATIWIAVSDDSMFSVSAGGPTDALDELMAESDGSTRVFELRLELPLPQVTVVEARIPDTGGAVTVTVAAAA